MLGADFQIVLYCGSVTIRDMKMIMIFLLWQAEFHH